MTKTPLDSHYKRYLEADICCTQQLMLPHPPIEKALQHHSEQLSRNNLGNNIKLAIFQQFINVQQIKRRQEQKNAFTRQSVSALNKRQREIRKSNYHLTQKEGSKERQLEGNNLLIAKEASFSKSSLKNKRPFSSASTRYLREKNSQSLKRTNTARPSTSLTTKTARPSTSLTRYTNASGTASFKKQQQFRLQNPLVIYPFESHMKSKRIDDNPKILANIISKKHKVMQKEELYDFVCKLMNRRAK